MPQVLWELPWCSTNAGVGISEASGCPCAQPGCTLAMAVGLAQAHWAVGTRGALLCMSVSASPSTADFTGAEGRENPSLSEGPLCFFSLYKTHHFPPCNVNSLFPRMNSRQGARERGWWWVWGCGALQGWAHAESQSSGRVLGEPGSGEG